MKVSVVIPVYNGYRYLGEAIDSVVSQTYPDVEIIVVNDGSNDDGKTRAVAGRYGSKIRYIEQENRGVGGALNTGLAAMSGDVFCWLSHDDVFRPHKIERQIEFFNRLGRDDVILFSNYALIDGNGRVTAQVAMETVIGDKPQLALLRGCINGCTIFVPKKIFDAVGPFDETLRYTQDYDMWKRMSAGHSFVLMADILVDYRLHPEQGTHNPAATAEANQLWINLVDDTSVSDRVAIAGSSLRFFQSQAEFLAATPYDLAAAHAFKRAKSCVAATKVSVVIPFFNEIVAAKRAILSALAQTHQNLDVIAVDDGSTDDPAGLELIAAADPRLRILRKVNSGPASARNLGMKTATGEYVAFLDGDDIWAPEKIAAQMRRMQEQGYLFSHTSYHVVHPERNLGPATLRTGKLEGTVYPGIIGMCPIHTSTVMMHRQLAEEGYLFAEAFRIGEDCLLWIDIAHRYPVLGIDMPLTTVEWSDTTAAVSLSRSIEGTSNILDVLSASIPHADHVTEIAELTGALSHLERLVIECRRYETSSDVNVDFLAGVFGSTIPLVSRGIARTFFPRLISRTRRLRSRFNDYQLPFKRPKLGSAKRLARKVLPRWAIEILKRATTTDYQSLNAAELTPGERMTNAVTLQEHFRRVDQFRAAGQHSEFERACWYLLSRFPESADAWLGAGIRAMEEWRNDLALRWLEKAATLRDTAYTQVYLGQTRRQLEDYTQSERHYRAALRLDKSEAQAHVGLAIILGTRDAFEEAMQHVRKAAHYGLDASYSQILLAGTLAVSGRLDEADAILSKNIAIAVVPPYKTDTRILRFGKGYRQIINETQDVPSINVAIDNPEGGAAVYFLCCDGVYFELFAEAAINSCLQNSAVDFIIHIHIVNRLPSTDLILARIGSRISRGRLRVTEEVIDLGALSDTESRTYYACRRFYVLPEIIRIYAKPVLCADVDQLVMRPVRSLLEQMNGYDVGLLHDPLNAFNLASYFSATAAFFAPTPAAIIFAKNVRRYIDHFLAGRDVAMWHLDQAALAVAYLNDPAALRLLRLPFSMVHSRPIEDSKLETAVFWAITYSISRSAEKLRSPTFLAYA
jgi:glycosyltransferase involved in cell wall biosynthesis/tetratricopeptide (TPR) repeat protein